MGLCPKPRKPFEKGLCENITFLHLPYAAGTSTPLTVRLAISAVSTGRTVS